MASATIVALPAVDDKVYRISSEKVPHLTLAYLGKDVSAEDLATIVSYVEHASSELSPFYMQADYRGTLGDDLADVVFFDKKSWCMERVVDFRHHLMLNDTLKRNYDSVPQYPEWTPHLTLGYPDSPAKEDDSDYPGIHSVEFDRIAVWWGDSEGPEFRLRYADHGMEATMAMSTEERGALVASTIFGHDPDAAKQYGVKGMRWGVTTVDRASSPTLVREKKALLNTKDVTVTQRKAGTYVKAKGGQRQKATDDAVKAVAARQKAKKSTTDSLTNAELQAAVERMRLEQQFTKLDAETKRRGKGFVAMLFASPEARKTTADLFARANAANN